jgi:spectrin beta
LFDNAFHFAKAKANISSTTQWINEATEELKTSSVGKDGAEVEELMNKHRLVELEVQTRKTAAIAMLDKYRVEFAKHSHPNIDALEDAQLDLEDKFADLHDAVAARTKRLDESAALHSFILDVQDEEAWIKEHAPLAASSDYGSNLNTNSILQRKHATLLAEIDARTNGPVQALVTQAQDMAAANHFAAPAIHARVESLQQQIANLHALAVNRKIGLDNSNLAEQYVADSNEAESWLREKEALIRSPDLGRDEHSASELFKAQTLLDAEVKAFRNMLERLDAQCQQVADTVKENESRLQPAVTSDSLLTAAGPIFSGAKMGPSKKKGQKMKTVKKMQKRVVRRPRPVVAAAPTTRTVTMARVAHDYDARQDKELSIDKGELLSIINQRDKNWWKMARSATDETGYVPASYVKLEEVMVQVPSSPPPPEYDEVQEEYEMEAEVEDSSDDGGDDKNDNAFGDSHGNDGIVDNGDGASSNSTASPRASSAGFGRQQSKQSTQHAPLGQLPDVRTPVYEQHQRLLKRFEELAKESESRHTKLAQATEAFAVAHEADDLVQWLNEKLAVASSAETGKDLEQVELLLKSFNGVRADVHGKDAVMRAIAEKLEGMLETCDPALRPGLQEKLDMVQKAWDGMNKAAQQREKVLVAALEMERFNRDIDETRGWISNKTSDLREDLGGDLSTVRQYQRQQDGFETELAALEDKVKKMEAAAGSLSKLHPAKRWKVAASRGEVMDTWGKLQQRTQERKQRLHENFVMQEFLGDLNDATTWVETVKQEMITPPLPTDVAGAEALLSATNIKGGRSTHATVALKR